jgi:hypothetical protein
LLLLLICVLVLTEATKQTGALLWLVGLGVAKKTASGGGLGAKEAVACVGLGVSKQSTARVRLRIAKETCTSCCRSVVISGATKQPCSGGLIAEERIRVILLLCVIGPEPSKWISIGGGVSGTEGWSRRLLSIVITE